MKTRRQIQRYREKCIEKVLLLCGALSVVTTIGIIGVLAFESALFFENVSVFRLVSDTQWTPQFFEKHFGIWPLVSGTLLTSGIALLLSVPTGLIIAVYLSEFASARMRLWVKPILEILAGVPTIVFGYFALLFVTPFLQRFIPELGAFNALSAGLVMGVMILPMVASLSEDAIYTVPQSLREAAYALGASKLQVVWGVAVPAAMGGITAAFILAASRAVGETMIVSIAAGQQPLLHFDPLQPVETMTAYIVQVSLGDTPHGTLEYHTLFVIAMFLFLITLVLNMISMMVRDRFKRMFR